MTYQSSPWQTHTAGQPARSGIEYFGLKSTSIPYRATARGTASWSHAKTERAGSACSSTPASPP